MCALGYRRILPAIEDRKVLISEDLGKIGVFLEKKWSAMSYDGLNKISEK